MPEKNPNLEVRPEQPSRLIQPTLVGVELISIEDNISIEEQLLVPDPRKIYSHTHQDGHVSSGTAKEIGSSPCPAMAGLGEKQIASALALAEIGQAMRQVKQKTTEQVSAADKLVPSETVKLVSKAKTIETAQIKNIEDFTSEPIVAISQLLDPAVQLQEVLAYAADQSVSNEHKAAMDTPTIFSHEANLEVPKIERSKDVILSATTLPRPVIQEQPLSPDSIDNQGRNSTTLRVVQEVVLSNTETDLVLPDDKDILDSAKELVSPGFSKKDILINFRHDLDNISTDSLAAIEVPEQVSPDSVHFVALTTDALARAETIVEMPIVELSSVKDQITPAIEALKPYTETEKMAAEIQSFFEQMAPLTSETISEFVVKLPPEEKAEIVAQLEMIVVVADRLKELISKGKESGDEALQIVAFLRREYEQLLKKVLPKATPEMIRKLTDLHMSKLIEDEGTHERKLFDEAGVFAKAQKAAAALKQNLQTMIGRVSVNNLAA